jgi:AcrR family transcriptional regulator
MTADNLLELRHRPVQKRGILRFAAILGGARQVLSEQGYEHFTIEDVAAAAAVPVGSVYQYFPNKFALVAELAAQDTEFLVGAINEAAPAFPTEDWQQEIDELIEVLAQLWADDPWRPALYAAMRSTAATRLRAQENTSAMARATTRPLSALTPHLSEQRCYDIAVVIVETCQTLLNLSVQDGRVDHAVVRETKRMIRAYLRSVALWER